MKKTLFIFLVFFTVPCYGFNLSVSVSGGNTWTNGVYQAAAADSLSFTCTPSSGTGPYTYSWNFDDLDTYKTGVSTSQNPSHTFDYLGLHKVWVTVTDTGDSNVTEKAVLLIDVQITDSENRVDVTNSDDVGANTLYSDGTNASTNTSRIATIISTYHNSTNGLTLYFPAGTYTFANGGNTSGRYYALSIDSGKKVIFEGAGAASTTLEWDNDREWVAETSNFFIYASSMTTGDFLMLRRLTLDWAGADIEIAGPQSVMRQVTDVYNFKTSIEDATITDFPGVVAGWNNATVKRTNMSGFGRFDGWAGNQGFIQAIDGGSNFLNKELYVADGYSACFNTSQGERCGHSKLWYAQNFQYQYIIDCYGDADNAEVSQDFLVFKQGSQDAIIQGNLFLNSKSTFIQLGKYDSQADDITTNDNRFIVSDTNQTVIVYSSLTDIMLDGNFSTGTAGGFLKSGDSSKCVGGLDADGITYQNNVGGYDDATPSASDGYSGCGGSPSSDVTDGGGNSSTLNLYKVGDPSGWYAEGGYVDPGVFEFVAPTNNGDSANSGSGMGASARFPFQEGALAQGHDGSNNYTQVELYADRANLSGSTEIRFADVDHNWSGPETPDFQVPRSYLGVTID
jgi:hypothetical protein